MEPINYLAQVADPFAASLKGYAATDAILNAEAKRAEALRLQQLQQQQQQQLAQEQSRFFTNPNPTMRDAARYASLLSPEQANAFRPFMEGISKEQQQGTLKRTGQLLSSLQLNPSIAVGRLKQESEAALNSGDAEEAAFFDRLATATADPNQGPGVAFKALVQSASAIPGAKEMFETIDKGMGTAREEEQAPMKLAEAEAKAIQEGVKAEFARSVAMAELAKTKAETLAPSVREAIDFKNLSPTDQAVFQNLQILKKPPAAVTNVNVSNVDKTASGELGKLVPDLYNQMNAASDLTGELARYRTALGTAITGPFADKKLQIAQVANAFGLIGDKGINATRELIQGNAEMSLKARSLISGQGQGPITEGEQALLVKARAGDINFTKGELNTLFNIFDRSAKAQYDQSRKLLQSATTQSPTAQLFLDAAKPFGAQTSPPAQPAAPAPAAATAAPVMPAGFRLIERGR